ncbi:MAG: BBP7 family outer membrane beta-barrel protein, partial [Planctomycetales bacterium]|nr:BBP7 family outer membrane beta-barrel protein [Planctomycetales bacterium]
NTELGQNDSEIVAYPGIVTGSMLVDTNSRMFSVSPRARYNLCCSDFYANPADACTLPNGCGGVACPQQVSQRWDLLLGYRYTNLDETLHTRELLTSNDNGVATTFDLQDTFQTENDFHGFEIGLEWDRYRGPWSLEWIGRVALGNNRESVTINGSTTSSANGVEFSDPGGLLALSSNIGSYENNTFATIPEMDVTLGYRIGPSLNFTLGYTLIYWNNVVRPGDQIDTSINPNLIPPVQAGGDNRPAFTLNETNIWAQGLSFGLDYRW